MIEIVINGDAHAFPLGNMSSHEIANTTVGERGVAVTFCLLCNSAIVFNHTLLGQTVEFGVSGMLRNSDLMMYDRATKTLWQQLTDKAIAGGLVGMRLDTLPASVVSWEQFQAEYPDGMVISRDQGFFFNYEVNSYTDYDFGIPYSQFFSEGTDPRLRPNEQVVAVERSSERVAYAFAFLQNVGVVHDSRNDEPIVVLWTPGASSQLDARQIEESRDVGRRPSSPPSSTGVR